ncbi:MAG: hypothetical protein RLZZ395_2490 [Pseudomonadota bacterium]|jgi:predicted DNA-binding mobile mystery protein A
MQPYLRELQLQQMDQMLASWKTASLCPRPRSGWVRAIRESLGMSAAAFARRLGMSHAGVRKLEASEASDAISLATLRKLAEALDCELQYALVPRQSLRQQVHNRAVLVVQERMAPIEHSMALEDQAVDEPLSRLQQDMAVQTLIDGPRRKLW